MSEPETAAKRAEQALTVIDRVVQFRWALLVVSFVLSADTALGLFWHQSLLTFQLGGNPGHMPLSPGAYVLFAGGYVFAMAGLFPLIQRCVEFVLALVRYSKIGGWFDSEIPTLELKHQFHRGLVRVNDATEEALSIKDTFWAPRLDSLAEEEKKEKADQDMLAQISFACSVLVLTNYAISAPGTISVLFKTWLAPQSDLMHMGGWLLASAVLFLLAGPWWYTVWIRENWKSRWIYHPDLARRKLIALRKDEIEHRPTYSD